MLPDLTAMRSAVRSGDEIDIPILMVTARAEAVDVIRGTGGLGR